MLFCIYFLMLFERIKLHLWFLFVGTCALHAFVAVFFNFLCLKLAVWSYRCYHGNIFNPHHSWWSCFHKHASQIILFFLLARKTKSPSEDQFTLSLEDCEHDVGHFMCVPPSLQMASWCVCVCVWACSSLHTRVYKIEIKGTYFPPIHPQNLWFFFLWDQKWYTD